MIWCVEDDKSIREIELYTLKSMGFEAKGFDNGLDFYNELQNEQPELVVLDVMLPGIDGIELLKKMKNNSSFKNIPVIMATAKGTEYNRVQGLDLGADDYLVKPFSMLEMVSRIKAVLRRCQNSETNHELKSGSLSLNIDQRIVEINGERIDLTYKEFELLKTFMLHPSMAYSREQLFELVWDMDYMPDSRTLDMHIRSLRAKLKEYGKNIQTVHGVGYRWEEVYGK